MKRTLFKNNNHNEQSANVTMCSFAVGGAKQKMSSVIPEMCVYCASECESMDLKMICAHATNKQLN